MINKRRTVAIKLTVFVIILSMCISFLMLTNPRVKIYGWRELDLTRLERIHNTVSVYDSDGNAIVEKLYEKNKIYAPIQKINQNTIDAFISIEDKRFYEHNGVDYKRILGAAKNNILAFKLKEGASTITQQLIKNTHLNGDKTFSRKIQEIRLAKQLEREFNKDEILEAYLNVLYFGNNIYGIGRAAKVYFNKDVADLALHESALLAAIINNPGAYNPIQYPSKALKRRNTVLKRMYQNNKITKDEYENAIPKDLSVCEMIENNTDGYIENVLSQAAKELDCLQEELFEKGAVIKTNLNSGIYSIMSDIIQKINHKTRILILDNNSARVICDIANVNDIPKLKRQPGSAIKPFVCYAPAFEKRLVYSSSVIQDEKTDFRGYSPKNFSDKYYGKVTVADSLKKSLNVPAVKLTDMCGIGYSKSIASKFGITFSNKDNGLAIALGGLNEGVTLNSLADAYATLARGGVYQKSNYVNGIIINDKEKKPNCTCSRAVGTDTAFIITDILMDCAQSGTAKKLSCYKNVAAKTGTVERGTYNSDAYCVAYTPKYTVAVWIGNDDENVSVHGGNEPTYVVKNVLAVLNDSDEFTVPGSVEKMDIDEKKLSDEGIVYLAAPSLPHRYRKSAYFSKNNMPKRYSYGTQFFIDDLNDNYDTFEIVD